jgi:hypothetical protein
MVRLKEYRLPRAQRLLKRVRQGERLNESDLGFLQRVIDDSRAVQPLVARHPEYHSLVGKMMDLYSEIISKALENEQDQP